MIRFVALFFVSLLWVLPVQAKGIDKNNLYAFETAPTIKAGAVFGKIHERSTKSGALTGVESSVCEHAELHQMLIEGGIMKMRKVEAIQSEKGSGIKLAPVGYHIMLMKLKAPLKKGDQIPLTLIYQNGDKTEIKVPVVSRADDVHDQ